MTVAIKGIVGVSVHLVDRLREVCPEYDTLPKAERLAVARSVAPVRSDARTNVTTNFFHESLVDLIDPNQSVTVDAAYLALGTGDSDPAWTDTGLDHEVYRVETTETTDEGRDFFTSTFVDTTEANGHTIREVGLAPTVTLRDPILNRALISPIEKSSDITATIDSTLRFRQA